MSSLPKPTTTKSFISKFQFSKQFQILSKLIFLSLPSSSLSSTLFQNSHSRTSHTSDRFTTHNSSPFTTGSSFSATTLPLAFQSPCCTRSHTYTVTSQPFRYLSTSIPFSNPNVSKMNELQEEQSFAKLSSKRITALFSSTSKKESSSSTETEDNNYSTKNRSRELKRLAKTMQVEVPKVKELLKRQAGKLDPNSEKGQYVKWLLNGNESKRKRSDSTNVSQKATAENDQGSNVNGIESNNKPSQKKTRKVRVKKPTPKPSKANDTTMTTNNSNSSVQNSNLHSSTKFQDMKMHPNSKKAIAQVLKHEYMSDIQEQTYVAAASGTDILGRARTGTGKTLAFLTPALERILNSNDYKAGRNIGILVISPTRELATQIGVQAEKLLTFHKDLHCQVMYGGTKMTRDVNMLNKRLPTILVATPGRLIDHLENTRLSGGRRFGNDIMRETPLLVLDEADRLLDMGFQREITKIMNYLPRQERRQTLLFSATVPPELKKIMADNMREDFLEIDCIGGDGSTEFASEEHTNILVKQTYVVLPSLDRYVSSVVEIVKHFMQEEDHKLVVFFPTARLVGFFAEFFNLGLGIDVIELHSRKTQGYRNQASDKFRKAKTAILFTSDVSARGE